MVTRLELDGSNEPSRWYREIVPANWVTLLRALTGVKRLHVVGTLVPSVVSALAQVTREATPEMEEAAEAELYYADHLTVRNAGQAWEAMIAAAPPPNHGETA